MRKESIKCLNILYQPKVNLKNKKITSLEALSRFKDEKGTLLNTEEVINLAKSVEEKRQLTTSVLNIVIKDLSQMELELDKLILISVNITSIEIECDDFEVWINKIFSNENFKYIPYIEFELSEKNKIENSLNMKRKIKFLKNKGFKVSFDDVGSGFNKVEIIDKYNMDLVKMDKSLIKDIKNNKNLIDMICKKAKKKGFEVVAEGIEDMETYVILKNLNCELGQGFYFHKPNSFQNILKLLA